MTCNPPAPLGALLTAPPPKGRGTIAPLASKPPVGAGAVAHPYLRVAPGLQRVARGVDCVEQRLLLVEIRAVNRTAEPDDPTRVSSLPTNLKFHDRHRRPPGAAAPPRRKCLPQSRRDTVRRSGCCSPARHLSANMARE